ncbi:MAG: proton-conducting transporter membrane subunit [Andreesenia angusta]|nr:proton-conducting transporter membrane subunit [Andreesenia angusta]
MGINSFPLLMILISYILGFLGILFYKNNISRAISTITSIILVILSGFLLKYTISNGEFIYNAGHYTAPWGIELLIGNTEAVFAFLFSIIFFIVNWYSFDSLKKEIEYKRIKIYYFLTNILIGSLLGVIFTNDIFNSYVFIEIGTLASCGIIVIKNKRDNFLATLKYLVLSSLGSGLFLMGIAFLFSITGNLNMSAIHREVMNNHNTYTQVILVSTALFTIGLGIKSALFPVHTWLPDGHSSAPTTSSALLSGLVIKAFFYLYVKIIYRTLGVELLEVQYIFKVLLVLGSLGMIMGSILAITQSELKRTIAYSTIAQMGYVFFGMGLGNKIGLVFAYYHIIAHALAKSILFLSAGAIVNENGNKYINRVNGIGKRLPIELFAFTLASLSMVGIPMLPGFVSKWNLASEAAKTNSYFLVAIVLISGLLNAFYYFPIVVRAFFMDSEKEKSDTKPLFNINRALPIILLSIGLVYVGINSEKIINIFLSGF